MKKAMPMLAKVVLIQLLASPLLSYAAIPATYGPASSYQSVFTPAQFTNCQSRTYAWFSPSYGTIGPPNVICQAMLDPFAFSMCIYQGGPPPPYCLELRVINTPVAGPGGNVEAAVYAQPNTCPANATLSGSSCTCNAGFIEDATHTACTPGGVGGTVIDVLHVVKPAMTGQMCVGNPIYPLLGGKSQPVDTGLRIGGQSLVLTYDSAKQLGATAAGLTPKTFGNIPSFGGLWDSSLHRNLKLGTGAFGAQLFRGNGHAVSLRYDPSTSLYTADADVNDTLTVISGGYRAAIAASQSLETYNSTGQLTTVADAAGNTLSYTYSTAAGATAPDDGYLLQVSDNTGRAIGFEYTLPAGGVAATDGLVSRIVHSSGQTIVVAYDAAQNLQSLTWADGMVQTYLYENSTLPWALTGVVDERSIRLSTFTYDVAGRAVSTEHAGGVNKFSVAYGTPPQINVAQTYDANTQLTTRTHDWQAPVNPVLTKPNGDTTSVNSATVLGYPLVTGASQSAGSGCGAANSASTYDAAGNLLSRDDFQGQRICYAYDTKNQEITRVEGLATSADCTAVLPANASLPAGARRISTQWHPDWRLPIVTTQPGLITTSVYQGQPDPFNANAVANCTSAPNLPNGKPLPMVCKSVQQATLASGAVDTAVPNRASSYTYDPSGRLLTSVDAANHQTSYTYYSDTAFTGVDPVAVGHTVGDLQSVTNAAGMVTTFNSYDRAGRVRQSTDAKGVVTDTVYTPRGWISSVTITPPGLSARTTSYTYDAAGQLTGVANPDGTSQSYSYDAAHRLIGASDNRGNTVTYTLDNMGNRISEQIKDPGGTLQRAISRSFDALNRLQQVSGALQ